MSNLPDAEELQPEQTEGFKVGEKKTIDEYQQLGECYESRVFPGVFEVWAKYRRSGVSRFLPKMAVTRTSTSNFSHPRGSTLHHHVRRPLKT